MAIQVWNIVLLRNRLFSSLTLLIIHDNSLTVSRGKDRIKDGGWGGISVGGGWGERADWIPIVEINFTLIYVEKFYVFHSTV